MTARCDLHVHSKHSNRPPEWIFRQLGSPESFMEPLEVYRRCRRRGMRFVTISDHDVIDGALEIAHLPGAFVSCEVTAEFPEDGCQIHCLAGRVAPEQRPAAETVLVRNLARAAAAAAARGITLLIEPINPRDRPDYFLTRVEHAADVIAKVGRPNLRMQFDCYHAQIVGGDLIRRLERHFPAVGHVQVAAVPSRHEPDEGEINYPEIFAALDRLGYRGFVGCEYRPRATTEAGLGWARRYGVVPRGG